MSYNVLRWKTFWVLILFHNGAFFYPRPSVYIQPWDPEMEKQSTRVLVLVPL